MFDIKRARNNFKGFRATMNEEEYDGVVASLDLAKTSYENYAPDKVEPCKDLIRTMTERTYFDVERREAHIQLTYRELEVLSQAMFDVALTGYKLDAPYSFEKCSTRLDAKIWENRGGK